MDARVKITKQLNAAISSTTQKLSDYCSHPERNFIRNRKLDFETVIRIILSMTGYSLREEIHRYWNFDDRAPTKSAFIQQRQKILPTAFRNIFDEFTHKFKCKETFNGYRLLACDGTNVNLPRNPADTATSARTNPTAESFNHLHINAMYDLLNEFYTDYRIDLGGKPREAVAFIEMAGKLPSLKKTILVADRGYGFLTTAYRLSELGANFVLRCKDITSNGFLTAMAPAEGEFDLDISKILTRCRKKEYRSNPAYMVVSGRYSLDFSHNKCYPVAFRACRFKLSSGNYECLITNLPRNRFSVSDLKQIYHLRWGIETSFRELKYTIGMMYFHSKKLDSVLQEIHAAMLMMNYCSQMIHATLLVQKDSWNYRHKINFAAAVGCCRSFFSSGETSTLNLILRDQSLIRPERQYDRYLHDTKPAKSLTYRVS